MIKLSKFTMVKKENFLRNLAFGLILFFLCITDFILKFSLNINFTNFLPNIINLFFPLILGVIGLYLIRTEYSGIKLLDTLNKNINTNNFNAILTLLIIFLIILVIPPSLDWLIINANFTGETKEECINDGACWTFVKVWLRRFIYGMYPDQFHWRINTAFIVLLTLAFVGYIPGKKLKKLLPLYYVIIYPIIAFLVIYYLISGGSFGLEWIDTGSWGGLSLTFIVAFFCLIFCFPIGVVLALARRSPLPTTRYIAVGFIEFWRGVPLITVLFMASVMFPMFLPDDLFIDKLIRVIIAISLFEAAYVAEVVRGGLQALPRGQYDAAKSLGMGYWKMHIFVILPQALKFVIPGIANTFLALVKDTPLIFVVGLADFVGMITMAKANPQWLGFVMEGYVFASIVFWIICYAMSRYSYNLEEKYKTER